MVLVELTSTALADLPLAPFKEHLRLGSGFSDDGAQDAALESYLRAAMAAIEARLGKILLTRQLGWTLTRWSNADSQPLPVAPVREVISVILTDKAGGESLAEPAGFALRKDTHRPRLVAVGGALPSVPHDGSVTINFEAGFGESWEALPADLRQAVFLLAAHYYENRHDRSGAAGLMPFGVMGLLESHRNIRTLGAR